MIPPVDSLRRWLIVRHGAIGDTLLLSSLIQAIRQQKPNAWIEVMGVFERVELLVGKGGADAAISSERPGMEQLYSDEGRLPDDLVDYFRCFDEILYFSGSRHTQIKNYLRVRDDSLVCVYPSLPQKHIHCTAHYIQCLEGLVPVQSVPVPRLALEPDEIETAKQYLESQGVIPDRDFIPVLHVGAGSRQKQAPVELFVQAAETFHKQTHSVCLIPQGPADEEAVSCFLSMINENIPVRVLRGLPLRKLAAVLSLASTTIGNDSGITHMAAAVGCPTLVLFTESDPVVWRPLGEHVRVVTV